MPADNRMSLTNILAENAHSARSVNKRSRPLARPPMLKSRMHSSTSSESWDYARPSTLRSDSTFSAYSAYSTTSTSSMDSNTLSVPYYLNMGLERSDSSDSCQSGQISPTTPVEPQEACQPIAVVPSSTRPEDLAAGVALTSLSQQSPYFKPAPAPAPALSTQYMPVLPPQSSSAASSPQQPHLSHPSPSSPRASASGRRSSSPRAPRDVNGNRLYPCPLATAYHCQQHFSTSGHARRHSRIHTGERGAECPECGQRFSRQDNMQQHRRTHRNGRDGRRAAAAAAAAATTTAAGTAAAVVPGSVAAIASTALQAASASS